MRLIDADALKIDISTEWLTAQTKQAFYKIIDNAPTVEPFCSYLSDGEVRQPCVEAPCKHERPQGKWEEDWQEDLDFMSRKGWKCPFCKWRTTYGTPNFCMNCGADMRKGGAV